MVGKKVKRDYVFHVSYAAVKKSYQRLTDTNKQIAFYLKIEFYKDVCENKLLYTTQTKK